MTEIKSITYIRAIAQLMIIGAHIQFVVPWYDRLDLVRAVRPFFENSTFPFFILSGLLLALINSKTSYPDFLRKKFKSVAVPYLIAILPVIFVYLFKPDFLQVTNGLYLMTNTTAFVALTSGKNSINIAMWFFPVICMFFFISPFFRWLYDRPKLLIAFVIFSFLLSNFTHRPPSTSEILRSFQYFVFPYSFGLLIARYFEKSFLLLKKWAWLSLFLFIIIYVVQVQIGALGGLDRLATFEQMSLLKPDLSLLQKLFLTLSLLGMLSLYKLPRQIDRFFSEVSNYAFGLHLYHGYFLTFYILTLGKWTPGYGLGMFFAQYLIVVLSCYTLAKGLAKANQPTAKLLFSLKQ